MRLICGSGRVSVAVALEDASTENDAFNGDGRGVTGAVNHSGDMFSGSIKGQ